MVGRAATAGAPTWVVSENPPLSVLPLLLLLVGLRSLHQACLLGAFALSGGISRSSCCPLPETEGAAKTKIKKTSKKAAHPSKNAAHEYSNDVNIQMEFFVLFF